MIQLNKNITNKSFLNYKCYLKNVYFLVYYTVFIVNTFLYTIVLIIIIQPL